MAEISGNVLAYQEAMRELHLVCDTFFWRQLRRPKVGDMYQRVRFDPAEPQDDLFTQRGIYHTCRDDYHSIWYWQERQWAKIRRLRAACRLEREGWIPHRR